MLDDRAFIGDLAFHGTHPYTADGHTGSWLAALDTLTGVLDGATLYPGHGTPGDIGMLADQRRSLQLFTKLGDDFQLGFAQKHHDVIARFGRFPHRNAMLGRAPRPEEIAAGDVFPW